MADSIALPGATPITASRSAAEVSAIPWFVWVPVIATTSAIIGMHWDISWHRTIGRDTFLTPAHLAIYLCGVLASISSGYMILHTTFAATSELRDSSVRMWGLRG